MSISPPVDHDSPDRPKKRRCGEISLPDRPECHLYNIELDRGRGALLGLAVGDALGTTNAAIVGALLGARDGSSAIPATWIERILAATLPGPSGWAEQHHPRHLLALV
jgi:hypothetical protein